MASLALTSLSESTLHFVKSTYILCHQSPDDIMAVVDFLKDRVRLSLHILQYLSKTFNNHQRLKLADDKIRVAASEAEYSFQEYEKIRVGASQAEYTVQERQDRLLLKILLTKADDIDLLSTDLLNTLMPEFFNHDNKQFSYFVSSSHLKEYEVDLLSTDMPKFLHRYERLSYFVSSSDLKQYEVVLGKNTRNKEKNEIVNFLIATSELLADLRLLRLISSFRRYMENRTVARCMHTDSRIKNWFPIRAWVTLFSDDQNEDLLKGILKSVLENSQLYSEAYQLRLDEMSSEQLGECLYKHLEHQRYFIVIHNWGKSPAWNEISFSFPDNKNGSRVLLFTTENNVAMAFGITFNTNLVLPYFGSSLIQHMFHHLVYGERSCLWGLKIIAGNISTICRESLFAISMVAKYLSRIEETTDNWLIVQKNICNDQSGFKDQDCFVIQALLQASEEINSIHAEEMSVYFEKCETKNKLEERFKHLEASSEVAEAKDNEKVGLDECLDQLVPDLLRLPPQLEKVAIVGMAGIGKTTLARLIFDHPSISSHFHIRAWIGISQFYQKRSLLIQLLQGITQLTDDTILNETDAQLEEKLYRYLKGQRYLIIMDDMWSITAWSELRRAFPDDRLRSRILLTCRESNVTEGLNCEIVHRMSLLNEKKSWDLLQKKVLGHEICPQGLVVIGKTIAARCEGLPLAIIVVAGLLSKIIKTSDSWEVVAESVSSHVMGSQSATRAIFALSYEHLPDYLKSCFLYMAAFPGGYEIEVRILIRSWIAEGFIDNAQQKCLEDVAEEYLNDLIERSLLLNGTRRSNGRLKTCRLHDLVLDFCVQEARKEKFLDVIKDFRLLDLKTKIDGHHRVSFHCHTFDDIHLTASKSLASSALFFGGSSHLVPDILIHYFDFKQLRVLDFISWRFDHFPTEKIAKLFLLRYLAFTASFELPGTLFKLQKLQTLFINGPWLSNCKISELPPELWKSSSLRHLQLRGVSHLCSPRKIAGPKYLNFLQTLTNITLGSCTHESLTFIPNILKLMVCETHEDFVVVGLWDSFFQNLVLLKCYGQNRPLPLPRLHAFPNSLKKLTLRQSNLPWEFMALIGDLPNLEVLKLRNKAFQGPKWETREGGFRYLKYLLIEETNLMYWELEGHHFPRLEQLVLKFCQVLEEIPAEIGDIPTLTHIRLSNCSYPAEISAKDIQEQCNEYGQDIKIHIRTQKTLSSASLEEADE